MKLVSSEKFTYNYYFWPQLRFWMVGAALVYMENTHTNKKVKIMLIYSVIFFSKYFPYSYFRDKSPSFASTW